jgi:hypothetical protein
MDNSPVLWECGVDARAEGSAGSGCVSEENAGLRLWVASGLFIKSRRESRGYKGKLTRHGSLYKIKSDNKISTIQGSSILSVSEGPEYRQR